MNEHKFRLSEQDRKCLAAALIDAAVTTKIDRMPGLLSPEVTRLAALCMWNRVFEKGLVFDVVACVPRADNPFAKVFAEITERPFVSLKEELGNDGRRSVTTTGYVPIWARSALLVEGMIAPETSKIEVVEDLLREGIRVSDAVVLVDCEHGGREELLKNGCNLHSVFTLSELKDMCQTLAQKRPSLYNTA